MKKTAFFGATIVALMSAGAAHAQQGHLDLSYQNNDVGSSSNPSVTAISGGFLVGDHVQLNGRYAHLDFGSSTDYWAVDGFFFNRSDSGAYGAFLGYDTVESIDEWSVGGFLQTYTDNANWTAQLGYSDTEGDVHVVTLDGEGKFFINDNASIQANLGAGNIDGSGNTDYWSGGIGAEVGLPSLPVSIYGGWQHYEVDGFVANDLGVGVRWTFGGGSVKDRNRTGASFDRVTRTALDLEIGGGVAPR